MRKSILLVFFLLLSCAKKPLEEVDLSRIDLEQFLKKVRKAEESVNSIKGLAYVSIKSPDRRVSFNQVTIAKEPNFLRLEARAPFGKTAGMVISDGEKVYVIFPKESDVFDSEEEFDLSFFYPEVPVKITVKDLVNLLLGRLPQEPGYEVSEVQLGRESNYLLLTFFKNNKEERILWINPLTYRVEKAKINSERGVLVVYKFEEFNNFGTGVLFPRRIEIKVNEFSISIRYYDEVEINRDIDRSLFKPEHLAKFEKKF